MFKKKLRFGSLTLVFVILMSSLLVNASTENEIHIAITNVDWPFNYFNYFDEYGYSSYSLNLSIEIWNPGKVKTFHTSSTCLFVYNMIMDLEGFYQEIRSRGICGCMLTTHTISSGITNRSSHPEFKIYDYNNSLPPYGEITSWLEFDDTSNSYDVISHITKLIYNSTGIYLEYPEVENWGATNTIDYHSTLVLTILIIGLFYSKRKNIT